MTTPAAWTPPPAVPPRRLIVTLAGAGAVAGALILVAFRATLPAITAHRAAALDEAVREVLRDPARYDTLFLVNDTLVSSPPQGADPARVEQIYVGFGSDSAIAGFAIPAARPGFADVVRLIFGYDAANGTLLAMKVLENKETPGLGDKIEKDSAFVAEFTGALAPLVGVKSRQGKGTPNEIDMITGATISSRTVIRAINEAIARVRPAIERYVAEGVP
ncbi:MAG TPA: FMN-binding protein [Gemmatimonadales bacterium]|nr:FMN-binding protein [Gemmatimonadales bacterium]